MFIHAWGARRAGYLTIGVVLCLLLSIAAIPAHAQSGSSIAQGFKANNDDIVAASLVSTKKGNNDLIELSTSNNVDDLVGVVSNKPLIELSQESTEIRVVTSGPTLALVSDLNGDVKSGDKVTASPIEGVGMKAIDSQVVVGTAQADLANMDTEERTITEKSGKSQKVKIGLLPVLVEVSFYSSGTQESSYVPLFLQRLANDVSGRAVSPARVLAAALILFLMLISVTVLLYSAVRSSIISIGRNPLSESAIRKSLLQVGVTIITILLFGLVAIYLVIST